MSLFVPFVTYLPVKYCKHSKSAKTFIETNLKKLKFIADKLSVINHVLFKHDFSHQDRSNLHQHQNRLHHHRRQLQSVYQMPLVIQIAVVFGLHRRDKSIPILKLPEKESKTVQRQLQRNENARRIPYWVKADTLVVVVIMEGEWDR